MNTSYQVAAMSSNHDCESGLPRLPGAGLSGHRLTGPLTLDTDPTAPPGSALAADGMLPALQHIGSANEPIDNSLPAAVSPEMHGPHEDPVDPVVFMDNTALEHDRHKVTQRIAYGVGLSHGRKEAAHYNYGRARDEGYDEGYNRGYSEGVHDATLKANEAFAWEVENGASHREAYSEGWESGKSDAKEDRAIADEEHASTVARLQALLTQASAQHDQGQALAVQERARQDETIATLRSELAAAKASVKELEDASTTSTASRQRVTTDLEEANEKIQALETELAAAIAEVSKKQKEHDARAELLRKQFTSALGDIEQTKQELADSRNAHQIDVERAERERRSMVEQRNQELALCARRIEEQQRTLEHQRDVCREAETLAASRAVTIRNLELQHEEAGRGVQQLERDLATALQNTTLAQQESAASRQDQRVAVGLVQQQRELLAERDRRLVIGAGQVAEYQRTIAQLRTELQEARGRSESQASLIGNLQEERDEARRQSETRQEIARLPADHDEPLATEMATEPVFTREPTAETDSGMIAEQEGSESDDETESDEPSHTVVIRDDVELLDEDVGTHVGDEDMDAESTADSEPMYHDGSPTPTARDYEVMGAYKEGVAKGRAEMEETVRKLRRELEDEYRRGLREGEKGDQSARDAKAIKAARRELEEEQLQTQAREGRRLRALKQQQRFTSEEIDALCEGGKLLLVKNHLIRKVPIGLGDVIDRITVLTDDHIRTFGSRIMRYPRNERYIEQIQVFMESVGAENVSTALAGLPARRDRSTDELTATFERTGIQLPSIPAPGGSSAFGQPLAAAGPSNTNLPSLPTANPGTVNPAPGNDTLGETGDLDDERSSSTAFRDVSAQAWARENVSRSSRASGSSKTSRLDPYGRRK